MLSSHEKRLSSDKLTRSSKLQKSDHPEKNQLRSSLSLMEQDRHYLLESLRELQKKNELENEKNFELGRNLSYQADHIRQLESEKSSLSENLKTLQSRLEELENAHSNLIQDRSSLKMSVAQMQEELHINRLQASDKELYIEKLASSYNEEKETILNVHSKHSRLLTSKLLADTVNKFVLCKKSWAFFEVKEKIAQKAAVGKLGFRFIVKTLDKRLRAALKALRANVREQKVESIMEGFVDRDRRNRIKKKVLEKIRNFVRIRKKLKEKVAKGMSKIHIVDRARVKVRVLRLLTQWKNVKVKDLYGKRVLWGIVMKLYNKNLAIHLNWWEKVSKTLKRIQANEDLASDLSGFALKQSVFYEFKRVAQLEAQKKKFNVFVARLQIHKNKQKVLTVLKSHNLIQSSKRSRLQHLCLHFSNKSLKRRIIQWQSYIYLGKKSSSISKVFRTHNRKTGQLELNNIFLAWKIFVNKNKHLKASKSLANEIPQRENYQSAYNELLSYNHRVLMTKSIKNIMKSGNSVIRSYFFNWQNLVFKFNRGKKNIAKKFFHFYAGLSKKAFDRWKDFKQAYDTNSLVMNNIEAQNENQVLLEHISNLDTCLKATTEAKSVISVLSMAKCIKSVIRLTKISNFRKWAQNALKIANLHSGSGYLAGLIINYLQRESFNSLKSFNQSKANKAMRQKKLYFFTFKKWKNVNAKVLESWVNFVRLTKFHRSKLAKILLRKYRKTVGLSLCSWFNWWKDLVITERDVQLSILDNECNQVREELEEVCNCLTAEKDLTWQLQELIKYKKLKRGFLSLCSISSATSSKALRKWKLYLRTSQLQAKYLNKMMNCHLKLDLKKSFNTWTFFKNSSIKHSNTTNLSQLMTEKKSIRRDMNSLKVSLESTISEKETKIQQFEAGTKELSSKIDKFLSISVRKHNETVVIPRTHLVFAQWKQLYSNKKRKLAQVFKFTRLAKLFKGFQGVRVFARQLCKHQETCTQIVEFLFSFRTRKLKHSFRLWVQNSFRTVQGDQSKELEYFNCKLNALKVRYESSKKNSINKALRFIFDKKKLSLLIGWKKVASKAKALKEAGKYFESLVCGKKTKLGVDEWRVFTSRKLRNKDFCRIMMTSRLNKLVSLTFGQWKGLHYTGTTVEKALLKLNFHLTRDFAFFAFSSLKSFTASKSTYTTWHHYTKHQLLKSILTLSSKSEQLAYFSIWHKKSQFAHSLISKLQKIQNSSASRIQSKGLQQWKAKISLTKTAEKVEKCGKSARIARKLFNTLAVFHKFIRKEGLSSGHLDEFLMQLLPLDSYLCYKKVDKSDRLHFRFILWKFFVLKRQKLKSASFRMCIFKHKGLILQHFQKWKRVCPSFSASMHSLPRHSLIQTLSTLNRDLKCLTESLKEKHVSLKYLESYTDILEEHVRRGQNQALANLATNTKKTLQTGLFRWFFNTQTTRLIENDFHLRDTEEELAYVRRKCKDFDIENKELVIENKGLLNALMKAEDLIMKSQF